MATKLKIYHNGATILEDVLLADGFWSRLSGYMFRKTPHVPAILFDPGGAIQTTFMNFNLDLVFLDRGNKIIQIKRSTKPWRMTGFLLNAHRVLEVPAGHLNMELKVGDELVISDL